MRPAGAAAVPYRRAHARERDSRRMASRCRPRTMRTRTSRFVAVDGSYGDYASLVGRLILYMCRAVLLFSWKLERIPPTGKRVDGDVS
jgi:hypothetical protein